MISCSKLSYVWEQGVGQARLQLQGRPVTQVLNDPVISQEVKTQIELVQKAKSFFYQYFAEEPTKIYRKVTFLPEPAVTHLVIFSAYDEVKAQESCFPFVGCFPYLGFFKLKSAQQFQKKQEKKGWVVFRRPVYAYSTLGFFQDRILSSFFHFKEIDLVELIFHELFHTVFFVKNEAEFNENLASFFARKLLKKYVQKDNAFWERLKVKEQQQEKIRDLVVQMANKLNQRYRQAGKVLNQKESQAILEEFLAATFYPGVQELCFKEKVEHCFPLVEKTSWNNARFAAFLSYEQSQDILQQLQQTKTLSLKEFYAFLQQEFKLYKHKKTTSFEDFLRERYL